MRWYIDVIEEVGIDELASDIGKTEEFCIKVLEKAEEMIAEDRFTIFLDIDGVLDVFNSKLEIQQLIPQAVEDLKGLQKEDCVAACEIMNMQ